MSARPLPRQEDPPLSEMTPSQIKQHVSSVTADNGSTIIIGIGTKEEGVCVFNTTVLHTATK